MRNLWAGILRTVGATLALVSCIPMLAMLPVGFATALSVIGLAAPPLVAWAAPLAPVASLLFIVSVVLLVIGNARCGWQPASIAALGGLLVYFAMYVLVTPATMDAMDTMSGMESMSPAQTSSMTGLTNASLFYIGVTLMVISFALVLWRRIQRVCRPFNPFKFLCTAQ